MSALLPAIPPLAIVSSNFDCRNARFDKVYSGELRRMHENSKAQPVFHRLFASHDPSRFRQDESVS